MLSSMSERIDDAVIKAQIWRRKQLEKVREAAKKKVDGFTIIELGLIVLVVIVLVILFRKQLVALSESLFKQTSSKAANVYKDATDPSAPNLN